MDIVLVVLKGRDFFLFHDETTNRSFTSRWSRSLSLVVGRYKHTSEVMEETCRKE